MRLVLDGVVRGDEPAVGLAVGAERPVVLTQRHRVDQRAGRAPRRASPPRTWSIRSNSCGELGAQVVVDVDQVLAGGPLVRGPGQRGRGRVVRRAGSSRPTAAVAAAYTVVGVGRRVLGRVRWTGRRPTRPVGRSVVHRARAVVAGRAAGSSGRPPPRVAATSSRTAGAISVPNRWTTRGSSPVTMNVLMPWSSGQLGQPLGPGRIGGRVHVVEPADLRGLPARGERGVVDPTRSSRPAASGGTYAWHGSQPSPTRPVSASILGPIAPIQISTSCAGAGPGWTPAAR